MLGKLFKHEFKETAKLLIPLNLVLVALTAIGAILLGTSVLQNESFELLAISSMLIYILSIFALFIITTVYLTIRYYKTMYSNEGYLTHTLPVSSTAVVNTKVLVAAFWSLIAMCITICSVFVLVRVTAGSDWNTAMQEIQSVFPEIFGFGFGELMAYTIASCIISCFSSVLMIFASLAIGQLFQQHRIIAAIVTYIIFYVLQQIIGTVTMVILGIGSADTLLEAENAAITGTANLASFYRGTFWSGMIESILFAIAFYVVCHYITKKKLNLE